MADSKKPKQGPRVVASEQDPLIGFNELAKLADVKVQTTWEWKKRGLLPKPDAIVKPNRAKWRQSRLLAWLQSTGRLPS